MGIAKYRQVTEWIQNRIATGELNRGDQIESENDISRTFGISRQTVRHSGAAGDTDTYPGKRNLCAG